MTRGAIAGFVGLALCAVLGLTSGVRGVLFMTFLYLALSAGWAAVRGRTWWGRMARPVALGCAGLALVVSIGSTSIALPGAGTFSPVTASEDTSPGSSAHGPSTGGGTSSDDPASSLPTETEPTVDAGAEVTTAPAPAPASAGALAAVQTLEVKGRAPRTGYDRERFGQRWADVDRNGCDQRNDVLRRDLADVVAKPGTHDCVVLGGTFADPYSGTTIAFRRGEGTSEAVQIDHVVALSDAWQKGAQQWDPVTRELFANDTLNLLAADGPLNQQKGDGDTATWLPPNHGFRCAYVARQVAVKVAYGLWVTAAERDAMVGVLSACPDEPLPPSSSVTPTASGTAAAPSDAQASPAAGVGEATPPSVETGGTGEMSSGGAVGCPVKGNHSSSGEWIYHVPGGAFYDVTDPEECFATPEDAVAAGYRASKR